MFTRWQARFWVAVLLIVAFGLHVISGERLRTKSRGETSEEMQVVVPLLVQIAMAGGDRFLAANLAGFRALVSTTDKMSIDHYKVLARVQTDAAWLNPAHEDNYYIAASNLPWNGGYKSGQAVLRKAIDARPFDWQPSFYYAFNLYHFRADPVAAAAVLREGAARESNERTRVMMESLAARWYEKGPDLRAAITVVESMIEQARHGAFKAHLRLRAQRLKSLLALQEAAARFAEIKGRPINSLDELVVAGLLSAIPADPLGQGFSVGKNGKPMFKNDPSDGQKQ